MNLIDRIYDGIHSLPVLPTICYAPNDIVDNPKLTEKDAARIISTDQVLTAKIVRAANAICCDNNGQIDSITQAIERLGITDVKNLIAAFSIIDMFSKNKSLEYFSPIDFWSHSIGVGLMSRHIGKSMGIKNVENFFLAGILHDIGKLLFFEYARVEYSQALQLAQEKNMLIRNAEMEVLGIDHSFAGELLAEYWKLPRTFKHAIRYHHSGLVEDKYNIIVASVHIADIMTRLLSIGFPGDSGVPQPNKKVWAILKLPPAAFSSITPKFLENYRSTTALFLDH